MLPTSIRVKADFNKLTVFTFDLNVYTVLLFVTTIVTLYVFSACSHSALQCIPRQIPKVHSMHRTVQWVNKINLKDRLSR